MEKPAPEVELQKKDNFMLLLDNKPNNQSRIYYRNRNPIK